MNSAVAKPNETVARTGACSRSVGNRIGGNDVSVSERGQGDDTVGSGIDVVAAAETEHSARHGRFGRLSTYESPASAVSKFRPILSKQPVVEETVWRQHAETIARSLPRRPPRGGLRSNRARKSHDTANSGGSARHPPSGQLENGELGGTGGFAGPGTLAWRPSSLREHGAPEAANSEPPLFRRHCLPQERGPEDDEQGDTAVVSGASHLRWNAATTVRPTDPKQLTLDDIGRSDQAATAIARGLSKRCRRRGRPPKRRPDASGASNTGGTGQRPVSTRVQHDAVAELADASLSGQRLQPRVVGGSLRAAVAVRPNESHGGDEVGGVAAAVVPEKRRRGRPITRSRPRNDDVGPCPARAIRPREMEGAAGDAHLAEWSLPRPLRRAASGEADLPRRDEAMESTLLGRLRKRACYSRREQPPVKRIRTGIRRQRRRELQAEDLASVLRSLEEEFAVKESLSNKETCCAPIPHERKVSTVSDFYKAFHDASTLPIRTCGLCYRKRAKKELREATWNQWLSSCIDKGGRSPFSCRRCFPEGETVSVCVECVRFLAHGSLSPAAQLHSRLGCEHMFPDELKGLTLVEEKLIALNSCYGFVTRYSIPGGHRQAVRYPRHVKGHITVFPNNVQELATNVLPHPLVRVMDEIHVSWQGAEKPGPSDLSSLLSVRRRVVERALVWLKKNNPHYAEIEIDAAEMESWGAPPHGVPACVYDRMERNEPSAWEKTRTAQVVPPTERAMDDEGSVDIEEILTALNQGENSPRCETGTAGENKAYESPAERDAEPDQTVKPINEVTSSGMFALDGPPDVADAEKLRFACDAVGENDDDGRMGPRTWVGSSGDSRRGYADGSEPYIHPRSSRRRSPRYYLSALGAHGWPKKPRWSREEVPMISLEQRRWREASCHLET
ncbi:hypothetical protein BGZ61DRAFT_484365 [Ilyonectria robusta]|uniref:uncharacterized protein n=1 Tax=Ilyonectria robusta TaxID=1079257 RepID=UPI001E8CA85D|nr:uncharacterized protein BGZ61DRAFT_484365 [Ilyonectria robusta]KAH8665657.1 hypothetical protein BGZ61DRAFT_484365 [Ilyonectria robusta]